MNLAGCTMERLHDDAELVVFRAHGPAFADPVLVLSPHAHGPVEEFGRRFEREHALAPHLEPRWAARPLRLARHEGRAALVLSDPGGAVLASALGAPLPVERVLGLARGLAGAIGEVHRVGLIHGDIRPANLLVGDEDRLWLTGFGCAEYRSGSLQPRAAWALAGERSAYLAPEWLEERPTPVDERADLYSIGVVLYELLTGELPVDGSGRRRPMRPGEMAAGIPAALDGIVLRLLAVDPGDRHACAESLLADLQACRPQGARPMPAGGRLSPSDGDRPDPMRLVEAVRVISGQGTPDDVGASLVRFGVELSGAVGAALLLLRDDEPEIAASLGGVADATLRAMAPYVLRDLARSDRPIVPASSPIMLAAPLRHDGRSVGALCLAFEQGAGALDAGTVRAVEALAAQGAVSLSVARRCEDLRRREALLVEGEALSHAGSWSLDLAARRLMLSAEHYRIVGLEPDVDARPEVDWFAERVHPDDRQATQDGFEAALRDGRLFEMGFRIVSRDERIKHVHCIGRPMFDEAGEVVGYVGTLMDVTRRRLAEERLQQAQAELAHVNRIAMLGELVASIAHEVIQPIGAGVTNCEAALRWLQREEPDLVEVENAVRRAVQTGRRASEVVDRLRALVRNSPPEMRVLDLNDVVHEALPIIQQELSRRDVTLELGLAPGALPVAGDPVQLQQVMINLVVNGAQAMERVRDRRRVVKLTTRLGDRDDVRLVVRDTGPGIDAQTRERLFNAFFTTKPNGMGIGLSICRSIVETHAGTISAASPEGGGAVFEVRLPLRPDMPA